ncbi:MAG: carbohydrate ABC transporter permease [Treponema sp.]|jgi:multiple sugar transport system permease protein|nr:carbohydrate ABC transporter permease [Treponema sp.]
MRKTRGPRGAIIRLFLKLLGILFLLPLVATIAGSFMTERAIEVNYTSSLSTFDLAEGVTEKFRRILLIPNPVSVEQYAEVLINQPSFLALLFNSLNIALPVSLGALVIALLSAYGFCRWRWKYKEAVFAVYIVVMLMPLQAVLVPNYIIATLLGIRTSTLAIILPGIFSPFGVFLMRQSMKTIPPAYIEAAELDGAGSWYTLTRVVIPQVKSSIAALCMLVFVEYWNVVEQAVIFIDDYTREPLSVYLSRLAGGRTGLIFAASCVYMFPPLWLLFSGQRDLEKGIELSGIR